jgi:glutamate-1-semialdehyde 2,1-aminomutase
VNLFGYDFYKECIERGAEKVRALGPVLGAYHPLLADNVRRLREISGLDEVSFHMSGTEAVMQAVRLARYHTRRRYLVRYCGAYHGWWGDVQPGVGNPLPPDATYTLKDMDAASLGVLRTRRDIACVLVNPLQAMHPNASAPADSGLIDSGRSAHFDRAAYAEWLKLRAVCVSGERSFSMKCLSAILLAGAWWVLGARRPGDLRQESGGGLPVGVACGRRDHEMLP